MIIDREFTVPRSLLAPAFGVADIHAEYERLKSYGVTFAMEVTEVAAVTIAVFDDTCGNLIQVVET